MLNKKYKRYIQTFLLVLPMTGLVCAINTFIAKGASAVLTEPTLVRWIISFAVAYPAVLVVQPIAIKLTDRITKNE